MKIVDRLICKTREKTNPWFAEYRRNRLNRTDFSIISNNCWAGSVYRYFGLQYSSPTEGLYFFPEDYIKFVSRLRHYLTSDIQFIEARDSRHSHELAEKGEMSVPLESLMILKLSSFTIRPRRRPGRNGFDGQSELIGTICSSNSAR